MQSSNPVFNRSEGFNGRGRNTMYAGNGMMIEAPRPGLRVRYSSISRMPYAGAVRPG